MIIKGLQPLSLVDYPGKVAATIFLFGCNFKCCYCHNPELVNKTEAEKVKTYKEEEILDFLKERKGFIDAVCITGGEPTLNKDIPKFIKKIKNLGYPVKLDTNGTNPNMLKDLIEKKLVDYTAMDIKAPLERYKEITNSEVEINNIKESIEIIKKFKNHEFRTTVSPDIKEEDILTIANLIKNAKAFYLQEFKAQKCLDKSYEKKQSLKKENLGIIRDKIKNFFDICEVRA